MLRGWGDAQEYMYRTIISVTWRELANPGLRVENAWEDEKGSSY